MPRGLLVLGCLVGLVLLLGLLFLEPDAAEARTEGAGASAADREASLRVADAAAEAAREEGARAELAAPLGEVDASATDETAAPDAGPRIEFRGRVVDDRGDGIEGAWVAWPGALVTTTSGPDGAFVIESADPYPDEPRRWFRLYAWKEGRAIAVTMLQRGSPSLLRLWPDSGRPIRVVRKADEAPLARARAELRLNAPDEPGADGLVVRRHLRVPVDLDATDGNGVTSLPSGAQVQMQVLAAGYREAVTYVQDRSPTPDRPYARVVELIPTLDLRVRFVDADSQPVAGATVAFSNSAGAVVTDPEGWVEVPESSGLRPTLTLREENRWWHVGRRKTLEPGGVLVVNHVPRSGEIRLPETLEASELEIATVAIVHGWGQNPKPSPTEEPERLVWHPVAADGSFTVRDGWQGEDNGLVVRDARNGAILLFQGIEGGGPTTFDLQPRHLASLQVRATPIEALADATLRLDGLWNEFGQPRIEAALEEGRASVELTPGTWNVTLLFAGVPESRQLGEFEMPAGAFEQTFDIGALRRVFGRVTADGEPVQGTGYVHGTTPDGYDFSRAIFLDADGRWELASVPDTELRLGITPLDPWLSQPGNQSWSLPSGLDELDVELPVAVLELTALQPESFASEYVRIDRRALPEDGGGGIRSGWQAGRRVRLPSLERGPARIRMSPCALQLHTWSGRHVLEPHRVELRAGEFHSVHLDLVSAGEFVVRAEGSSRRYSGSIEILVAGVEMESADRRRRNRNRRSGELMRLVLEPGRYEMRMPNGLRDRDQSRYLHLAGEDGPIVVPFTVEAGRLSELVLEVDAEGGVHPRHRRE